ncbi:MAG: glycine dehydrogenase (aminomethyl-transferring), partial [Burkholderiales bacterium]|nr:glycine dehydrogenase (aminomethyl-transferring) [Burkholderiales bacterium]
MTPLSSLENHDEFIHRHIGPDDAEIAEMLAAVGAGSLDELVQQTVPAAILGGTPVALPDAVTEEAALASIRAIAQKNVIARSFIGMGYHETITPKVILRNVFENPGWYTAYTPYQAEISQGRLQCLLNFQQMILDLTGLELANASLLDEATAAAEAMAMARRLSKTATNRYFVDRDALPQTIDVMKTRAQAFGWELIYGSPAEAKDHDVFGALFQYPNVNGKIGDIEPAVAAVKAMGGVVALACDPMALVVLKSPASLGADIALGSAQRFGVPMGFGGPHAAFFATKDEYKRSVPGRIIGVSVDSAGNPALRMALQTREQHIRREKANSNICTSQVLLANIASLYAVYHGPVGLKRIANRIHRLTAIFAEGLKRVGVSVQTRRFFDTVVVDMGSKAHAAFEAAQAAGYNLRHVSSSQLGVSFSERATRDDVKALWTALVGDAARGLDVELLDQERVCRLPEAVLRTDDILTHPVFNAHHTETEMLRFIKKLQNKDLALDHAMISLGSCTMKLNAT